MPSSPFAPTLQCFHCHVRRKGNLTRAGSRVRDHLIECMDGQARVGVLPVSMFGSTYT